MNKVNLDDNLAGLEALEVTNWILTENKDIQTLIGGISVAAETVASAAPEGDDVCSSLLPQLEARLAFLQRIQELINAVHDQSWSTQDMHIDPEVRSDFADPVMRNAEAHVMAKVLERLTHTENSGMEERLPFPAPDDTALRELILDLQSPS